MTPPRDYAYQPTAESKDAWTRAVSDLAKEMAKQDGHDPDKSVPFAETGVFKQLKGPVWWSYLAEAREHLEHLSGRE